MNMTFHSLFQQREDETQFVTAKSPNNDMAHRSKIKQLHVFKALLRNRTILNQN